MANITIAGLVGKTAVATDELEVQATGGGASNKVTAASLAALAVAGSNTQVIFNDGGAAGATADLTFDKTTKKLSVGGR